MKTTTKKEIISTLVKRFFATIILGVGLAASSSAQMFCQAAFTYTVGSSGQVSFTNTSTGTTGNSQYWWNFGGNATSSLQSPNHTYTYNGTYYVTLTIDSSNGNGGYCAVSDTIVIANAATCNLNAAFTYTTGSNGNVSFTDASTGTSPGMIYSWSWYGNNGNGSSGQQSPLITFIYNGTYYVTLNVSDSTQTCYNSVTDTVVITNAQACQVSFTYTVGTNGQVSFTNTSQGNISYYWYFGDGTSSTQQSPSHTYYNGTYYVYMWADSTGGYCSGQAVDTIVITNSQNAPTCNASFTYVLGNSGQVSFTNTSSGTVVNPTYSWNFGDGSGSSNLSSPSYTYAYNGTYNVTFYEIDSTTNNIICSYSAVVTITNTVNNPNCADSAYFYMYPDSSQTSTWNVYLATFNSAYPINATWTWGDGTSSSGLYPSHTYASAGWYNICVTAYFACGDSSYYCQADSVYKSSSSMVTVNVINTQSGIKNNTQTMTTIKAFPNPFTDDITVNFTSYENKMVAFTMYDMMGNQLLKESVETHKGDNEFKINTNVIAKGVYFINISGNDGKKASTIKMIK